MIKVSNLRMSFGPQLLFDNVGFSILRGERIGLIGRNGSGKTTLLNLLCGKLLPDEGIISRPRDYSIGYIEQNLSFSSPTVLEEGCLSLSNEQRDEIWRVEKVLSGLGFSSIDLQKDPKKLSDGYKSRLQLGKLLVAEHDLLLLDEPTNYLDITSLRWLSGFLSSWKKELVLVTHDRWFMDAVATHIMAIHRKRIRKIKGSTARMYELIAREEEIHEKTRINDERKRKEEEIFISRFRAKARLAGLVQSRIRAMQKREKIKKLEKIKSIEFAFHHAPIPAKHLMVVKELAFSYTGAPPYLIKNLSFSVGRSDRIGVVGQNGRGKSTLLRLLNGELKPLKGSIHLHHSLSAGYFGQSGIDRLNPHFTVEEELSISGGWLGRKEIMDVCGAMLFGEDLAQKKIAILSGGEKSRVLLGKLLLSPLNLLLLDEPTNHLDLESSDSLLAAIDSFEGAVIIATHNEMFLNTLVNRLIVFQRNGVFLFEGSYSDFLERVGWEMDFLSQDATYPGFKLYPHGLENFQKHLTTQNAKTKTLKTIDPFKDKTRKDIMGSLSKKLNTGFRNLRREELEATNTNLKRPGKIQGKKELRVRRAEIISARSKALKPLEDEIKALENEIESLEENLKTNNQSIIEASQSGRGETISELSIENHRLKNRLEELYMQLEELLKNQEKLSATFDAQLKELEGF
jgi:ATP-binding cassette subfamily F protein 3